MVVLTNENQPGAENTIPGLDRIVEGCRLMVKMTTQNEYSVFNSSIVSMAVSVFLPNGCSFALTILFLSPVALLYGKVLVN